MSLRALLVAMLAAVSLVAAALVADERDESEAAVQNLTNEQVALATAVAADFETRLLQLEHTGVLHPGDTQVGSLVPQLLGGALKLQKPGSRTLLVVGPDRKRLLRTDGTSVSSALLMTALRSGVSGLVIPRDQAPSFGFPERIAIAGLQTIEAASGTWSVVVLASGQRLRARERHAQLRFLLGLGLVTAIISGIGALAIRQQRRELQVSRALEVAAMEREHERLLAKADKMATLAALSSGIAHEVATPLGTIMARVEQLLPDNIHDERATSALRVVLAQVERIQTIIRGVLSLARGEAPPLLPTDPRVVANGAITMSRHRFAQARVELTFECDPALPELAGNRAMLEQALTNLLLNACDASPSGSSVRLSVHVESDKLLFVVEDQGEGISFETAARAQEPFFTTKPSGVGHGLGLAITREVVSHHGGKLRLEPRAGTSGTRAVMELPIR